MKTIIAGGRNYSFTVDDYQFLDSLTEITEVVSGGCSRRDPVTGEIVGADHFGEMWAESLGIPVRRFKAEWNKFGKSAGPMRNAQMARYADACVLFPGGRGTDNMYEYATKFGLVVHVRRLGRWWNND